MFSFVYKHYLLRSCISNWGCANSDICLSLKPVTSLIGRQKQETRMLSQALNRAMPHSRNQLKGVNRKKVNILFSCITVLYIEAVKPASALIVLF